MPKRLSRRFRNIIIIVICFVSIILVGSSVAMLAQYANVMNEGAGIIGLINSDQAADIFRTAIDKYRNKSEQFAENLLSDNIISTETFSLGVNKLLKDSRYSEIMFARYFKDGVEYSLNNQPFDMTYESKAVIVGSRMEVAFCTGIVEDRQYSISAICYCIPLRNCPYADCIALFFPVDGVVDSVDYGNDINVKSQLTVICSTEGEVLAIIRKNDTFTLQKHNNIYEFLRGKINDKSVIDSVQALIDQGRSDSYTVSISGHDHVLAASGIREHGTSPFSVIALYKADDIYSAAYSTVTTVLAELAVFFAMLVFVAVYFIISYRASERRIKTLNEYNEVLGCPTRVKFQRDADKILNQNKGTQFAVVVVDVRHFDYMTDHIGSEQMNNELKRIKGFYARFMQVQETFGYAGNGRFLLLLHYRDEEALGARLKTLSAYLGISKVSSSGERITLSAYGGIYMANSGHAISAEKMVDNAIIAENASKYPYDFDAFRIYNEKLHSSNVMNEYIEVNMQSALDNKLFRVFYQPKYNVNTNSPDGCEALVRWFNPETNEYMQPAVFLPLFEENRFIVKLDKYVYEQVCIYISETVAQGKSLFPISVNVSRITVSEPSFLDYYISIKNKYHIADNFLTIEFTESFAFEDYEMLRETVNVLHKNGFRCSIDDFGSGFSSYNILKELPMDEIKLDRFFILKGLSEERDLKVLSSVIQLGRGLKMKVTQEGVETRDQMIMMKQLGCDVIQGYYYSKPLVQGDYDDFLTRKFIL